MEPIKGNFLYDDVLPRVELISWLLAILGLIFKFLLLRGGDMLLMVGLGTLAVVYFLRAFAPILPDTDKDFSASYESIPASQDNFLADAVGPKVQSIATAVTLIGILFKLLFWTGAMQLLLVGTLSLAIVLAIGLYSNKLLRESLLFAALGSNMILISTDDIVRQFYRDDSYLVEKMIFQHHHPRDRAARTEVQRLLHLRRER